MKIIMYLIRQFLGLKCLLRLKGTTSHCKCEGCTLKPYTTAMVILMLTVVMLYLLLWCTISQKLGGYPVAECLIGHPIPT